MFKDGSDVEFVSGSTEPFTLRRFKEDSGFGYARIVLFLKPLGDIFDQLQESLARDSASDSPGEEESNCESGTNSLAKPVE